jgi:hypothetical protein
MVAVVLAALLFWVGVFMIYFTAQGVSPFAFFAGRFEPYDPALGRWKEIGSDADSGLLCEQRLLLPEGREGASFLVRQTRYRDPETRAVTRVGPAQRIPRRRIGRGSKG